MACTQKVMSNEVLPAFRKQFPSLGWIELR